MKMYGRGSSGGEQQHALALMRADIRLVNATHHFNEERSQYYNAHKAISGRSQRCTEEVGVEVRSMIRLPGYPQTLD